MLLLFNSFFFLFFFEGFISKNVYLLLARKPPNLNCCFLWFNDHISTLVRNLQLFELNIRPSDMSGNCLCWEDTAETCFLIREKDLKVAPGSNKLKVENTSWLNVRRRRRRRWWWSRLCSNFALNVSIALLSVSTTALTLCV